MLVPLRRAYSEGEEFINQNTYEFDVRPHTARDTHTATQRPPQLQCVCGRERVWRVVRAGDRAGHQSEMISEPEREAQIKLMQCQRLGVKRAGRRPALSFQAPGTLAQAEQAAGLAPGQATCRGRARKKTPG